MAINIADYGDPGIIINEKDFSLYTISGSDNNVTTLIIGVSRQGPMNLPIQVNSPENFEEIFGSLDRTLERKGSFFHQTVENLLASGSTVTCINLLLTDPQFDLYNWMSFSTTAFVQNSPVRSNAVDSFYDKRGFWKRSPDQLLTVANNSSVDANPRLFNLVNMGGKAVSVLIRQSANKNFDITLEDWYGGRHLVPNYLHPLDFVSDYLVEMFVFEGRWDNYRVLSTDPKLGKYFNSNGLKKELIQNFVNEKSSNFIQRYEGTFIPYFADIKGNDMWLPSLVNDDIDTLGILVVQDIDKFEMSNPSDYMVDILGASLEENRTDVIDFLSYKENIVDLLVLDEMMVDQIGNDFGFDLTGYLGSTSGTYYAGRRIGYAEGYVQGCRLKPLILSSTGTVTVNPFDCDTEAYVIFKGQQFTLSDDISYVFALHENISTNMQALMLFYVDITGIHMTIGAQSSINGSMKFPYMDPDNTLVLGYYRFYQIGLQYYIELPVGVTIDINGFILPYRLGSETAPKIHFQDVPYAWQINLYFENVKTVTGYDYNVNRIYYLWSILSQKLVQKVSMVLDVNSNKKVINFIEPGDDNTGRWLRIGVLDTTANIRDTISVNLELAIYFADVDFIFQDENILRTTDNPFVIGQDGIVGRDSMLYQAYKQSFVNTGDHFFLELATEINTQFIFDNGNNLLVLQTGPIENYLNLKIFVYGSQYNDGEFNVIGETYYNNYYALVLDKPIVAESVAELGIFDASVLQYLNLYMVNDILYADYKVDPNQTEVFQNIVKPNNPNSFRKTVEIQQILNNNIILVDATKYVNLLNVGDFLLADTTSDPFYSEQGFRKRDWVRIIDIVAYAQNTSWLLIEADAAINITNLNGSLQTTGFVKVENYVNTYNLHTFDGFKVRPESMPDGTETRLNDILNLVAPGTKLFDQITDPEILEWRYLVDSFGLGLTTNCKQQLADICGAKTLGLGFLNLPSAKSFKKSTSPTFTDPTYGNLSIQQIVNGGSRVTSGSFQFGLADGVGISNVAYFFPYVIINDDGRPSFVPPASFAASLFLSKYTTRDSQITPWTIMAGADRGFIAGIAGTEMEFTQNDLNLLNLLRVNPIQTHLTKFYAIASDNTAESKNSVLGNIHVREALISLESSLRSMLKSFQWKFSIPSVRAEILRQANNICQNYFTQNAIANYKNICDETNNTPDLIDAQIGVLDTFVEPIAGMGTIVLNIGVDKTGGIQVNETTSQIF
jgi:hypothetical protein